MITLTFTDGTNAYYSSEEHCFSFDNDLKERISIEPFLPKPGPPVVHTGDVPKSIECRRIRITLGYKCNFKCTYCSEQANVKVDEKFNIGNAIKLSQYIATTLRGVQNIELIGGEPFVYWKAIKEMIPILRPAFPKARISIITNGSIASENIVNFLLEHKVSVSLSYDGQMQEINRKPIDLNPWVDFYHRAKTAGYPSNPFCVNTVLTQNNHNIRQIIHHVRSIFDDNVIQFFIPICAYNEIQSTDGYKQTTFTEQGLKELENEIYHNLVLGPENEVNSTFSGLCSRLLSYVMHGDLSNLSLCSLESENVIVCNLEGQLMQCSICGLPNAIYGSIYDLKNARVGKGRYWTDRKCCRNCPFVPMCLGGCPLLTDQNFHLFCKSKQAVMRAVFRAVVEWTFKRKLASMDNVPVPYLDGVLKYRMETIKFRA